MSRTRVLIVDDDADLRRLLDATLREHGYDVAVAPDGRSGVQAAATGSASVVLLDLGLPDMGGMEVLRALCASGEPPAIVVMTGQPTYEAAVAALKEGADNFVTKPLDLNLLTTVVRKAEESARLRRQARHRGVSRGAIERLELCPSPAMRALAAQVRTIADSDGNVLISGETGSGKSLVARAVHELSRRASGPFVELNCASLGRELLESELFGHAAGAFTGAVRAKPGLFEVADGGTLLLDEIGDMDPSVQPKLLKAIEDRRIRRLGSVQSRDVDVRLVAASHFDLSRLVQEGRFRSDLYFRLDVLRLRVPPLRERPEDVPVLAVEFLRTVRRAGRPPLAGFSDAALAWLCAQPWPGNVRELQNVVERAAVHAPEGWVLPGHLGAGLPPAVSPAAPERSRDGVEEGTEDSSLDAAERRHVVRVLRAAEGNRSEAARRLGITRQTLLRKLRSWGVAEDEPTEPEPEKS